VSHDLWLKIFCSLELFVGDLWLKRFCNLKVAFYICQGTSFKRQRSDIFGLWVKLPLVTTCLTTQR